MRFFLKNLVKISREKSNICREIFRTKFNLAPLNMPWSKIFSSEFLLSLVLQKPLIVTTRAVSKIRKQHPEPHCFFERHRSFFTNCLCWISSASWRSCSDLGRDQPWHAAGCSWEELGDTTMIYLRNLWSFCQKDKMILPRIRLCFQVTFRV